MVTRDGEPVAPPTDQHMDAALWRIRESVWQKISTEQTRWSRRRRTWAVVAAGVLLFGGGIAVGGAALRPLTNPSPVFEVTCYGTTTSASMVARVEFDTEAHAAAARLDPAGACENIQVHDAQTGEIDSIVTGLLNQGDRCGTVTTDDGKTWMFEQVGDGLSITSGTFSDPLPSDCANVHVPRVTSPTTQHFGGVACAAGANRASVYASTSMDAAAVCGANGDDVYSSTAAK